MGDGVALRDGDIFLNPCVELCHIADLVLIVQDDVGQFFRQFLVVLNEPGVAVGTRNHRGLRNGEGSLVQHESAAVHQADGLQERASLVGLEGFGECRLGIGHLGIRPNPGAGAGLNPLELRIPHIGGCPAGDKNAPEPCSEQESNPCRQCCTAFRELPRFIAAVPLRKSQQAAECRPSQIHKGRCQANQRGAQNQKIGGQSGQKAQPEQRFPRGAAAVPERPRPGKNHHRKELAGIHARVAQHTENALRRADNAPQSQYPANPVPPGFAVGRAPDKAQNQRQCERLCEEFGDIQRLCRQTGQALCSGKAVLRVIENQPHPFQQDSDSHSGKHPGQERRRTARTAQGKKYSAPRQAEQARFLPAPAQHDHSDEQHRGRDNALRKCEIAQAGAHGSHHHKPRLFVPAGIVVMEAQKRRRGKVELLAHIVRA